MEPKVERDSFGGGKKKSNEINQMITRRPLLATIVISLYLEVYSRSRFMNL